MYLTPDWEANNYGETVFFEEVLNKDGRPFPAGKQQYEWIASVRPRYGRIVIFRGIIPHSARPPSPGFTGARYTFACKVCTRGCLFLHLTNMAGYFCKSQFFFQPLGEKKKT